MQKLYGTLVALVLATSAFGDEEKGKGDNGGNQAPAAVASQRAQGRSVGAYRNLQRGTAQGVAPQPQIGSANLNQQRAASGFQLNRNFNRANSIYRRPVNTTGAATTSANTTARVDAADNILSNLEQRRQHGNRRNNQAQSEQVTNAQANGSRWQAAHGNANGGRNRNNGGNRVIAFNNQNTQSFHQARQWEGCGRRHDPDWWRSHCRTVIFIGGGYYGWNAGYWYPAFGYDDSYSVYASADPIYGYDGLPPDQVIASVQSALQELGYFENAVDGVLGPDTRAALANYQRDAGIFVSAAIDRPTLVALGFIG